LRLVYSLALSVDDLGTVLFILILGDPLGLEGGKGAERGTTGPDGVVSIGRSDNLDLFGLFAIFFQLLGESIGETLVERGTTGQDDVAVEIKSDIEIASLDGRIGELMKTLLLRALLDKLRVENSLGGRESRTVDSDRLAIRQLEDLIELARARRLSLGILKVQRDKANSLLHLADNLLPGTLATGRGNTIGGEKRLHKVCDGSTSDEVLKHGVGNREALVDRHSVGDTITGVTDKTGGTTVGIEGEDGLDGNVKATDAEGLEHDLGHLLSVGLGVVGSLSEEDAVLGRVDSELIGEAVLPDLLHVIPVLDDTGLDGVAELEDTSHLLGLITDILGLALRADELLVSSRTSNNGGELNAGSVLSGETGLEDTGTIVENEILCVGHL
jgi:hypothetical protein